MTKWIVVSALFAFGCGSDCDKLKKKLCEGQDEATCTAMKKWFDDQMEGPDGKKLSSDEAEVGCKMIMSDDRSMKAYVENAVEKNKK
jgi:hypothetical protein